MESTFQVRLRSCNFIFIYDCFPGSSLSLRVLILSVHLLLLDLCFGIENSVLNKLRNGLILFVRPWFCRFGSAGLGFLHKEKQTV